MDMNILNPGQDFDELPESYVIFITKEDVLGDGEAIYHINRTIEESGKKFPDETHIIYVNAKRQDDTELGRLMHDLHCTNAKDMYSKVLAERVYELKETQKGVDFMCQELEQIYSEGMEIGEKRGERRGMEKKAKKTAITLSGMGMSLEKIAEALETSTDTVKSWIEAGQKGSV